MLSNEAKLAQLYAQRQELQKKLCEVNLLIRDIEHQTLHEKVKQNGAAKDNEENAFAGANSNAVGDILDCCVQDINGLREAMRVVDSCRAVRKNIVEGKEITNNQKFCNAFLHEMIARAHELMVDPNGSELFQNALGVLKNSGSVAPALHSTNYMPDSLSNISEVLLLLKEIKNHLQQICNDTNGTRVMQKLFDYVKSLEEVEYCVQCFAGIIIPLCKDINGSHVVVRLLSLAQPANVLNSIGRDIDSTTGQERLSAVQDILYKDFAENCVTVCKSRQGCCVIQKCLRWAPEPYFSAIIDAVLQNTRQLVGDPFGNYVVQFILDFEKELSKRSKEGHGSTDYRNITVRQMLHHVASLSRNKFSSNVIEKCLKTVSSEVRQLLVDELTDPQELPKLLTDSYANYVIQTAIATSSEESQFAQLRDSIMPLQKLLKNSPYGVKVEAKLARRQRDFLRKQRQQKHRDRRKADVSRIPGHANSENFAAAHQLAGMQAISPIIGAETLNQQKKQQQQALAFSGISDNIPSLVPQAQYLPLMLPGQQPLLDLQQQGRSQEAFQVNLMSNGAVWGQPQSFTLFQQTSQGSMDR